MANDKKEAKLTLKVKSEGKEEINSVSSAFNGLKTKILAGVALITTAMVALKRGFDLALDASRFQEVRRAFTALANSQGQDADKMLIKMRELSAGTVSDMELMRQANQALLLGLPVEKFGDMLTIARSAAKSTGESMEFMLQSIVTGLGRGSKLMLDNLGIVFKIEDAYEDYAKTLNKTATSLTEAEKKQAFINKALEVGKRNAEAAGSGGISLADKWEQLKAATDNLFKSMGEGLIPAFSKIVSMSTDVVNFFNNMSGSVDNSSLTVDELNKKIEKTQKTIETLEAGKDKWNWLNKSGNQENLDNWKKIMDELVVARDNAQQRIDAINEAKRLKDEEEKLAEIEKQREHDLTMQQVESENRLALFEIEQLAGAAKLSAQLTRLNKELKNEKDYQKRKELVAKKASLTEQLITKKKEEAKTKLELEQQKTREQAQASTLAIIAGMQNSSNKALATIGKAAALTQIAIQAPIGISRALAAFPPPFNFAAAASVGAAFAVQAARVSGVQLADGGIVSARMGGTPAILGEGGRDEAVVPLENGAPALGGNTYILKGFFTGDEQQFREMIQNVDRGLFELKQDNGSIAFESDVV